MHSRLLVVTSVLIYSFSSVDHIDHQTKSLMFDDHGSFVDATLYI